MNSLLNHINIDVMKKAVNFLVRDNHALRIRITEKYRETVQYVTDYVYEDIEVKAFSTERELEEFAEKEACQKIEMTGRKLYSIFILHCRGWTFFV